MTVEATPARSFSLAAASATSAEGASIVGRAVSKRFAAKDTSFVALDNVSFEIGGGEFVSLIGPSGCGKSTLMLITAGLIPPSDGEMARSWAIATSTSASGDIRCSISLVNVSSRMRPSSFSVCPSFAVSSARLRNASDSS